MVKYYRTFPGPSFMKMMRCLCPQPSSIWGLFPFQVLIWVFAFQKCFHFLFPQLDCSLYANSLGPRVRKKGKAATTLWDLSWEYPASWNIVRNRFHNKLRNFTKSFDKTKMAFWWYFDGITARVFRITLLITPAHLVQLREIKVHKGEKEKKKKKNKEHENICICNILKNSDL